MITLSIITAILGIACIVRLVIVCIRVIRARKRISLEQLEQSYKNIIILTPFIIALFLLNAIFYRLGTGYTITYEYIVGSSLSVLFRIWPIFIALYFLKRWINKISAN